MSKELLMEIGLTEKEAEVYLVLLEIGSSPVNRIHEKTGIQRRNIYDLLNNLIKKGIVTCITENKKTYFQAKNPEKLLGYIEEQKQRLDQKKEKLAGGMEQLKKKFASLKSEQEAEIYRGIEGVKTILLDCLDTKEVLFIGATGLVEEKLPYFWPQYNKKRIKNKVMWKLLLNYEARNKPITRSKFYNFKLLPKELSGPNVIYIYGDKIANVLWVDPPISFVITDKRVAQSYRGYFNFLWSKIK
jgi:sugar-specific transcriptional regulator TrmB